MVVPNNPIVVSLEEIWGLKWALKENTPIINFVSWNSRTNRISIK